jgi:hypothetical protein
MLLAGDITIQNPELIFAFLMGPELYEVYLAMMMCMVVMYVIPETCTFW